MDRFDGKHSGCVDICLLIVFSLERVQIRHSATSVKAVSHPCTATTQKLTTYQRTLPEDKACSRVTSAAAVRGDDDREVFW